MVEFDNEPRRPKKPSLDDALAALQIQGDGAVTAAVYYGLSDLASADIERVRAVWNTLKPEYRRKVMRELADASETDFEQDYRAFGLIGLDDEDAEARAAAVEILWMGESLELMSRLIEMAQWDESLEVRAAAVVALGRFVLLGEYGELPEQENTRLQDVVVGLLTDDQEDLDVRRRALEAIANSSHEIVRGAIEEAYHSDEHLMRVSAVFAMGRTCDKHWRDLVLREMSSASPELRYEAARAAGEIGLAQAVPLLGRLALEGDRETQDVAIWSLGEIGGREAQRILSALAEDAQQANDDALLEAVEEAIAAASIAELGFEFDLDDDDD